MSSPETPLGPDSSVLPPELLDRSRGYFGKIARKNVGLVVEQIKSGVAVAPEKLGEESHRAIIGGLLAALPGLDTAIEERRLELESLNNSIVQVEGELDDSRRRLEAAEVKLSVDSLTGLLSVNGLEIALESWLESQANPNSRVAVAVLDLDGFKSVNREVGHVDADSLLSCLGRAMYDLRGYWRSGDLVARWHGDEFIVIMPETSDQPTAQTEVDIERRRTGTSDSAQLAKTIELDIEDRLQSMQLPENLSEELAERARALHITAGIEVYTVAELREMTLLQLLKASGLVMMRNKKLKYPEGSSESA